jgi:hypothetical protein
MYTHCSIHPLGILHNKMIIDKCLDLQCSDQPHRCTLQKILDEQKSKQACLAQQNGFGPTFLLRKLRLAKGTTELND